MTACAGLPPVADAQARALVLGSMPGARSLALRRYYGHPHNAFWPILGELVGARPGLPYRARLQALRAAGIGLWDVLRACERAGSLDADIAPASMRANDFAALFRRCPGIRAVFCNGGTAFRLWRRLVVPTLPPAVAALPVVQLPSTSPAHASVPLARKLHSWRALVPALGPASGDGAAVARGRR